MKSDIFIAVQDRGPAEYIAHFIEELGRSVYVQASLVSKKSFEHLKSVIFVDSIPNDLDFKLIITGTCLESGIDKEALKFATNKKIKSISIIEHWSLYKKRFIENDQLILPDFIVVNDEVARDEAILDGLPKNKIQVIGNPKLESLLSLNLEAIYQEEEDQLQLNQIANSIVFVSESLKYDVEDILGFNEYKVIEDILWANKNKFDIYVKLHPAEDINKYQRYGNKIKILSHLKNNMAICKAPIIIGMGSMLLVEASFYHKNVISYRPNAKTPFIGNTLLATQKIELREELILMINQTSSQKNMKFKERFIGSKIKMINFIKDTLNE